MNIHKYLLPAAIAATVHVALLMLTPEENRPAPTLVIELPLRPPFPEVPEEPVPVEVREKSTEPVNALPGGPARPELPETIAMKKAEFRLPMEERLKGPVTLIDRIPTIGDVGEIGSAGGGRLAIFSPVDLDRVPRAKVQIPPEYPYAMKQSGAGGTVLVEFEVDATGRVVRAEALNYTDREFAEPALRAVRKWRFEPGRRHGKAVPFRMTIPIEFGIENT